MSLHTRALAAVSANRPGPVRELWPFGPASAVTLVAGAVMMASGYLFAVDGWAVAGVVMTPAGPLISVAFALARKARGGARTPDLRGRVRHVTTLLVGMPSAGGNLTPVESAATSAIALLAGAVMVLAGYAIAKWNPLSVPPIVLTGGAVILAAFIIADRGGRAHPERIVETKAIPARTIQARRIEFEYPPSGLDRHFMNGDPAMSHVVAVLSALFPEGEDFFVRSVRNYRDQITDPELKKQVSAFIGQESIHGREHRSFNKHLGALGYPTWTIDRIVKYGLGYGGRILPKAHQLAITAALEHYTATLAETLLGNDRARAEFGPAELNGGNALTLLLWHAIEESEHKSVAFDVLQAVNPNHRLRALVMDVVTVDFLLAVLVGTAVSILLDPHTWRHPLRTLASIWRLRLSPWAEPAVVRRIRAYNRPDFHPDDNDATALLTEWRSRLFGTQGSLAVMVKGSPAA